jgi:hypothetical protein
MDGVRFKCFINNSTYVSGGPKTRPLISEFETKSPRDGLARRLISPSRSVSTWHTTLIYRCHNFLPEYKLCSRSQMRVVLVSVYRIHYVSDDNIFMWFCEVQ